MCTGLLYENCKFILACIVACSINRKAISETQCELKLFFFALLFTFKMKKNLFHTVISQYRYLMSLSGESSGNYHFTPNDILKFCQYLDK